MWRAIGFVTGGVLVFAGMLFLIDSSAPVSAPETLRPAAPARVVLEPPAPPPRRTEPAAETPATRSPEVVERPAPQPPRPAQPPAAEPVAPPAPGKESEARYVQAGPPAEAAETAAHADGARVGTAPIVPLARADLGDGETTAPSTGTTIAPTAAHGAGPEWFAIWDPFHSELSANAFARRLERVTGLDYRVLRLGPAQYQVAVAYHEEAERAANLAAIEAATGLRLAEAAP